MASLCTYVLNVLMCLTSACRTEKVLFIFGVSDFICYRSVPGEYELSIFKNRSLSDGFQDITWPFS
jgi:hypothetical protein